MTSNLNTMYSKDFNPAAFNSLPDIDEDYMNRPTFTIASTQVLKSMLVENLGEYIGLWYPHKHFDVEDGEYIVSCSKVQMNKDLFNKPVSDVVLETSVIAASKEYMSENFVPATLYKYGDKWMPMQYIAKDVPGAQESYDYFLKNGSKFLPTLTETMKLAGLEGRMGLVLRNDTALKRNDQAMLDEKTDKKQRLQRFFWGGNKEPSEDTFVTYWCIDEECMPDDKFDKIKASYDILGFEMNDGIVKVGCQRAHQVCAGINCSG